MKNNFIPYELALKLKELGFNEKCLGGYDKTKKWWYHPDSDVILDVPIWNQAFDWFRDKHKLFGLNSPLLNNEWAIVIDDVNTSHQIYWSKIIGYEEARLECLKKLIEIAKEKCNTQ